MLHIHHSYGKHHWCERWIIFAVVIIQVHWQNEENDTVWIDDNDGVVMGFYMRILKPFSRIAKQESLTVNLKLSLP